VAHPSGKKQSVLAGQRGEPVRVPHEV